jgi:hypothetical protein
MTVRTRSEFAHFFATELVRRLKKLDARRKAVLRKVKTLIAVLAAIIFVTVLVQLALGVGWTPVAIVGILCFVGGSSLYRILISGYVSEFKAEVIWRIVGFFDPGLTYRPGGSVRVDEFHSSRIFTERPDRMQGGDLVQGRIGATGIKFSEVHAERRSESSGSHGRRTRYSTIFKGLFFMADFNKKFYGKTVVLPDTAQRFLGGVGSFLQSINRSHGELIRMDNPEFEKHFVVYGDDQIEARYVLSPSLLQRIVAFRKKTGRRVYLSFVGSQVFVAIPYRRPLFEPRVFTSITSFKCAEEYFHDLELALGIVDDLNLNARVWAGASFTGSDLEN